MNRCNLRNLWTKMNHAGVYIHIPFCRSHCSYCDFATGMYESTAAGRYVRAVTREISQWKEIEPTENVDTIYFGGGTPSLLSAEQIEQILQAVHDRFRVSPSAELTIEMNPGTTGVQSPTSKIQSPLSEAHLESESAPSLLTAFRRLGINRASFGAQTFDDADLRQL